MNATDFAESVRDAEATQLGRLGSDKYLVAATGADLATPAVLRSVATQLASGRDTFAAWAEGADDPAHTTFAAATEIEAAGYDRVATELEAESADLPTVDPGDAVHRALQSSGSSVERAGAMVGRGLVADRTRLQVVNFFVNEGDSARADLARDLRADATDQIEAGGDLVATLQGGESDVDRAREAARGVIDAAYSEYAETLESMGVDPKPVC